MNKAKQGDKIEIIRRYLSIVMSGGSRGSRGCKCSSQICPNYYEFIQKFKMWIEVNRIEELLLFN